MPVIIALCGTSGVGKGYLKQKLKKMFKLTEPPVYTTRKKRKNEKQSDRIFVTPKEFAQKQKDGEIVLPQELYGNSYGFARKAFEKTQGIITEVHIGVLKKFRQLFPSAIIIGLTADNLNFLDYRLRKRSEKATEAQKRIAKAEEETRQIKAHEHLFDIVHAVNFENEGRAVREIIEKLGRIQHARNNLVPKKTPKPNNAWIRNTGRTKRKPNQSPGLRRRRRR